MNPFLSYVFLLSVVLMIGACGSSGGDSAPDPLAESEDPVTFFPAYNLSLGTALWKTDGTSDGTVLAKDVSPSNEDSDTSFGPLRSYQGGVAFSFSDAFFGSTGLWISDETSEQTSLIFPTNLWPIEELIASQNGLYFTVDAPGYGRELWHSDGSQAGTSMVKDLTEPVLLSADSQPMGLFEYGSKVLFSADDLVHGRELWVSDGTKDGTSLLKNIQSGSGSGLPGSFISFGGRVWFGAQSSPGDVELWSTDGTTDGTTLFGWTNPFGRTHAFPHTVVHGSLLFFADGSSNGTGLWVTDGTVQGTALLMNISPSLNTKAGEVYYIFDTIGPGRWDGYRLLRTDGTAAGTFFLEDPRPDVSWYPSHVTAFQDELYFTINTASGIQMWRTNSSISGLSLVTDFTLPKYQDLPFGTQSGGFASLEFIRFIPSDDTLYFGFGWREVCYLFKTDGTEAGTLPVKDIFSALP